MKIIAFAEQRENKFKKAAYEVTQASAKLAVQLGAEHITVVIGSAIEQVLPELGQYGATKIIAAQDPKLQYYSTTAYAKILAEIVRKEGASVIVFPATQMGKDLSPRVAAKLDAGIASDVTAWKVEGSDIIASRPVYAAKAMIDVKVTSAIKIFTLRPNVFTASPVSGGTVVIEKYAMALSDPDFTAKVTGTKINEGRPDVTEASIVVAGGRGLKAPDNFHLVEKLADAFGGAVGVSRAVVDAGWRPHDEQVGQTGKTVSPTLYVACGISGAVQHLAGMSSSKYIVAINKDKDAPIFQVADYGMVGDLFEILPPLIEAVKKVQGK